MDICTTCKKLGEIVPNHRYCRECYKAMDRKRYYKSREKRLEKDRVRFATMAPEQRRARAVRAKELSPEKLWARQTLRNAVRSGKVIKTPCETCGEEKVHGHHNLGYEGENVYKVQWLCKQHHYEQHRKYNVGI